MYRFFLSFLSSPDSPAAKGATDELFLDGSVSGVYTSNSLFLPLVNVPTASESLSFCEEEGYSAQAFFLSITVLELSAFLTSSSWPDLYFCRMRSIVDMPLHFRQIWKQMRCRSKISSTALTMVQIHTRMQLGLAQVHPCRYSMYSPAKVNTVRLSAAETIMPKNHQQLMVPTQLLIQMQWWSKDTTQRLHLLQCRDNLLQQLSHLLQYQKLSMWIDCLYYPKTYPAALFSLYSRTVGSDGSIMLLTSVKITSTPIVIGQAMPNASCSMGLGKAGCTQTQYSTSWQVNTMQLKICAQPGFWVKELIVLCVQESIYYQQILIGTPILKSNSLWLYNLQNMERVLTVTTYFGKTLQVTYTEEESIGQLKAKILSMLTDQPTINDFDLLYRGKLIKDKDQTLGSFIDPSTPTIYVNSKGVHGGCYKIASGGCG